jgi:predicted transcriptional regulator
MSAQPALLQPSEGPRLAVLALRHKGVAHGLFMLASDAKARGIDPAGDVRPLGSACRLCDIRNCAKRIEAPALQPQGLNDYRRAATDFEPV